MFAQPRVIEDRADHRWYEQGTRDAVPFDRGQELSSVEGLLDVERASLCDRRDEAHPTCMAERSDQQVADLLGPLPVHELDAVHRRHAAKAHLARLGDTGGPARVDDPADRLGVGGTRLEHRGGLGGHEYLQVVGSSVADVQDARAASGDPHGFGDLRRSARSPRPRGWPPRRRGCARSQPGCPGDASGTKTPPKCRDGLLDEQHLDAVAREQRDPVAGPQVETVQHRGAPCDRDLELRPGPARAVGLDDQRRG